MWLVSSPYHKGYHGKCFKPHKIEKKEKKKKPKFSTHFIMISLMAHAQNDYI